MFVFRPMPPVNQQFLKTYNGLTLTKMEESILEIVLADDDTDDCIFFRDALDDLKVTVSLTIVNDGEELMQFLLSRSAPTPDAIYLDLNMPRKNGYECLVEIKKDVRLKLLPVIIFSTSQTDEMVDKVYQSGAGYYIRKPAEYKDLKDVIMKSIYLIPGMKDGQAPKENFVVNSK
jgi:CheY-like chemotaxis protein